MTTLRDIIVMEHLVKLVTPTLNGCPDVDVIDQLHHVFTMYILVAFAGLVGVRTFTVGALDCWYTNNTVKHFQEHVNTYCWTHKLYKYPGLDKINRVHSSLSSKNIILNNMNHEQLEDINFFRWVTVIFLAQAFMFILPRIIWIICNKYSGIQIEKLVFLITDKAAETKTFERAAKEIQVYLKFSANNIKSDDNLCWILIQGFLNFLAQHVKLLLGMNTKICLLTSHFLVKFLYLAVVMLQYLIISKFLDLNYITYCSTFFENTGKTGESIDIENFPQICLCKFQADGYEDLVQCLLNLNMLLGQLFLIEWFWLLLLFILTSVHLLVWSVRLGFNFNKWVKFNKPINNENKPNSKKTTTKNKSVTSETSELNNATDQSDTSKILPFKASNKKSQRDNKDMKPNEWWDMEFMAKYLTALGEDGFVPQGDRRKEQKFVLDDLGSLGVFVLRIMADNSNEMVMTELVKSLWILYTEEHTAEPNSPPQDSDESYVNPAMQYSDTTC